MSSSPSPRLAIGLSNRSAQTCAPVSAAMSCGLILALCTDPADAALQQVADAELLANSADIERFAAEREGGLPRDHEGAGQVGQVGRQVLGNAVGDIGLLGIAAQIFERQHGD